MADKPKGKEATQSREVAQWRPFADLTRWERDMERMMDEFFDRRMRHWWPERWFRSEDMLINAPLVDVFQEQDDIVVKADLPGVDKDNLDIQLTDHTLTIKGEKRKEDEIKEEHYYRTERSYGTFMRSVQLPMDVQTDKVKAAFKNGVLEVRLPKTEEAKNKEIKVKVE
jgi:HSP20 family protein